MSEYIVSARKYRPSTFHAVVGQESLTSTLKGSILNGQLAHAYLFCGSRGVGKTTCARIFAKAINCLNIGSDGEPCNQCESCKAFNDNASFNIHELDAASNNGVDQIRGLIDQVRIPPQLGKYSIYIVDEVHMLSNQAFNAFLKTLEEPPAHAKFILATTERHKILPTILSRCQIYNFNRIKVADTVKYLSYIAEQENVQAEQAALTVIAQKSDGAMRDALSIFDQLVSFCGNNITYNQAIEHLNVLDYDYYFKITDNILDFKVKDSLLIFDEILNKGFDAQYFISGLASHFRDLLVSKDPETSKLLDVSNEIEAKYKAQNQRCPNSFIYSAIELATECDYNYRLSRNKRLSVELLLIKLCGIGQEGAASKKVSPKLPKITVATISDVKTQATAQTVSAPKPAPINKKPSIQRVGFTNINTTPTQPITNSQQPIANSQPPIAEPQNEEFTHDMLLKAWRDYANTKVDSSHTIKTMINFLPEIETNNTITVILANKVQIQAITTLKNSIKLLLLSCSVRPACRLILVS